MAFNKDQTIEQVLRSNPQTMQVFLKYGMHCFGCHISVDETVEQAALAHRVNVESLMKDLNAVTVAG